MALSFGGKYPSKLTVWEIRVATNKKYRDVKVTSSRKKDGTWEQDFGFYIRMLSTANEKASKLQEKDKIVLNSLQITGGWNKEKKCNEVNFVCFDFDKVDKDGNIIPFDSSSSNPDEILIIPDDIIDEELPFM